MWTYVSQIKADATYLPHVSKLDQVRVRASALKTTLETVWAFAEVKSRIFTS